MPWRGNPKRGLVPGKRKKVFCNYFWVERHIKRLVETEGDSPRAVKKGGEEEMLVGERGDAEIARAFNFILPNGSHNFGGKGIVRETAASQTGGGKRGVSKCRKSTSHTRSQLIRDW